MMKKIAAKIFIFVLLLLLTHLFLLKDGFWFYQDGSFWPKTVFESQQYFFSQLLTFSRFQYFHGYDQGVLAFTRFADHGIVYLLTMVFGGEKSQVLYSVLGYVLSFISFTLFARLFFKNSTVVYLLALLFTFNPLFYSFRGAGGFLYASAPLFMYAFFKYMTSENIRFFYVFLSLLAAFFWIIYIRFVQINIIIIVPYLIYLFIVHRPVLWLKKLLLISVVGIIVFSPILYSVIAELTQGVPTVFHYAAVLKDTSVADPMYMAFNILQTTNIILYDNRFYTMVGIILFSVLLYFFTRYRKKLSILYIVNFSLILLGLTFFGLGTLVNSNVYALIVKFFPFLTNGLSYGLYILNIGFIILVGQIMTLRPRQMYVYSFALLLVGIIPFLRLDSFQMKKFPLDEVPLAYQEYFISTKSQIPEASHYIPHTCWRAEYMRDADVPTMCFNFGWKYNPVSFTNPRLLSGADYEVSKELTNTYDVQNLRVTHNLKHLILAEDAVPPKDQGPLLYEKDIRKLEVVKNELDNTDNFLAKRHQYFTDYVYKDHSYYDFFIYSPAMLMPSHSFRDLFSNTLPLDRNPAYSDIGLQGNTHSAAISYKVDPVNPTKYYIKLSDLRPSEKSYLQFNQTYSKKWKLWFITKEQFDSIKCQSKVERFVLSNNERCTVTVPLLSFGDIRFLFRKNIADETQTIGNIMGNLWEIPKSERTSGTEVYMVLLYDKQILYSLAVFISIGMVILLCIISLIQEYRVYKNSR